LVGLAQNAYSGTNIGTYGQYSLGVSGALANTGWVGFVRVDYRNGSNLTGWDGTGGFRYSFTPEVAVRTAMPVKAPVLKAPASLGVTWNGFYVGAFGGAEIGSALWGYQVGSVNPGVAGILGGVDGGYNWQNGPWVFGLEGDFAGTDAKGGAACNALRLPVDVSSPLYEMTCNARQSWIATVTPRIGLSWDRALFYVKGGLAVGREEFSATCNFGPTNGFLLFNTPNQFPGQSCAPVNPTSRFSISNGFSASDVRAGWTIGYGVQFALTQQWSTKVETDYTVFSDHTLTASDGTPLNVGMHVWQTKIGVNYRFGGPVAAAY
jgi:opacity protein-like surface antigen